MVASLDVSNRVQSHEGVVQALLNARYYNSTQGQFLSEDPVFLGDPKQQMLTDQQSLNSSRTTASALNLTSGFGSNSNIQQPSRNSTSGWSNDYLLNPQAQNPYSYADDNPVTLSDPNGKFALVPIALAALEIYGLASTGVDAYSAYNANKYPDGYTPKERKAPTFSSAMTLRPWALVVASLNSDTKPSVSLWAGSRLFKTPTIQPHRLCSITSHN